MYCRYRTDYNVIMCVLMMHYTMLYKDLTWSYAEVLNAMYYRGIAIQALKA